MKILYIFYLFISLLCYIKVIAKDCKSKNTKPCHHNNDCLKATFKSSCKSESCGSVYRDGHNQLLDCDYDKVVVNLTDSNTHNIAELFCRDENMKVVVLSASLINGDESRNITEELTHICALSNFCSYRANHLYTCSKTRICFSELRVHYFCKETGTEEAICNSKCNNHGRCTNCIPDHRNPLESHCTICKCNEGQQLVYSNGTVINRFCSNSFLNKSKISSANVILAVVSGIIFSGFIFALLGFLCIFLFRRNKYQRNDHQGLMSYPVEHEM